MGRILGMYQGKQISDQNSTKDITEQRHMLAWGDVLVDNRCGAKMCRVKLRLLIGFPLTLIIEYDYGVGTK